MVFHRRVDHHGLDRLRLQPDELCFVLGMVVGNVVWVLSGPPGRASMPLAVIALYWILTFTLIVLYLVRDGASALAETETDLGMTPNRLQWSETFVALNVLLSPVSCGFSWTFWMDGRTLIVHYHTSLYTSVILSVSVPHCVSRVPNKKKKHEVQS